MNQNIPLGARIFPLRRAILMIDEVNAAVGFHSLLPAFGQRTQRIALFSTRSNSCSSAHTTTLIKINQLIIKTRQNI